MKIRHHICTLVIFLLPELLIAQQTTLSARTDRNAILIGERIRLSLEADIPETAPIRFFDIDSIDHFEFIERGKIDTINTSSGTILRQVLVLTSFDSGRFSIPPLALDADAELHTDSIPVWVSFSAFDTAQAYHDVKDIIDVEIKEEQKPFPYWITGAVFLLILAALFMYFRRRKKEKPAVAPAADLYKDTMKSLDGLPNENLQVKEYYSRLTDIFRLYLDRRYGIHSLQKTTEELTGQLAKLGMEQAVFESLRDHLRIADFVKFAKYNPSEADKQSALALVKAAVQQLESLQQKTGDSSHG